MTFASAEKQAVGSVPGEALHVLSLSLILTSNLSLLLEFLAVLAKRERYFYQYIHQVSSWN